MAGEVVAALRAELGAEVVLTGEDIPERNRDDWSGLPPTQPLAVVRPRTTAEVAAALRVCHAHRQPVVPQGGLTGLCGGGRAGDGEVALFARADGRRRGDQLRDRHHDRPGRHAARARAAGGRRGRLLRPARPGCARLLRHRRQHLDQRRRQPRHPLRHDPRDGARPRGRAGRRHRPPLAQQADQEQRRHRPQAPVHRQRGHARRRHARRPPPPAQADQRPGRLLRARRLRRRAGAPPGRPRRPRARALGLRGDVARLLPLRDDPPGCSRARSPADHPFFVLVEAQGTDEAADAARFEVLARAHPRDRHHRRRRPRPVAR